MQPPITTTDELLEQARASARQNDHAASRELLRQYLTRQHALTWLARVTTDPEEARAAALLALRLNPDDEIAQRALASVGQPAEPSTASITTDEGPALTEALAPVEVPTPAEAPALTETPPLAEPPASITFVTGLTLAEARATIWPFEGRNRTIGDLLDSGAKTLKDIAWAYTAKVSAQVRVACKTILLAELLDQEPAQLPRPLRVIGGSRYTEEQERKALWGMGALSGAMVALCTLCLVVALASIAVLLNGLFNRNFPPLAILGLVVLYSLIGVMLVLFIPLQRRTERARSFRVGRWGEERIVEQLRGLLDGRWTLLRNVVVPGRAGGDIDLVLVGPPGVWALEVKAYRGLVRNRGDRWERKSRRGWARLAVHPGKQARSSATRLQGLLERGGLKLAWVHPAVIWASSAAPDAEQPGQLLAEAPQTPVWQADHLAASIDALRNHPARLDEAQVDQVVAVVQAAVAGRSPAAVAAGLTPAS
ncbi:MAG: hypothetical protein OHK0022_46600 [Roseiflexaceae bacterium]